LNLGHHYYVDIERSYLERSLGSYTGAGGETEMADKIKALKIFVQELREAI
jgi:hypothetical protein